MTIPLAPGAYLPDPKSLDVEDTPVPVAPALLPESPAVPEHELASDEEVEADLEKNLAPPVPSLTLLMDFDEDSIAPIDHDLFGSAARRILAVGSACLLASTLLLVTDQPWLDVAIPLLAAALGAYVARAPIPER